MSIIEQLLDDIPIPGLLRVRQRFARPFIQDPAAEFRVQLQSSGVIEKVRPGQQVAVAVGSRGITNLPLLVKLLITALREAGAEPFIVPAMGSHGGATAVGQQKMLETMGISEATIGVPVRSSMEVVKLGTSSTGIPVYLDKHASQADGIIIINRIKPHVGFRGPYESGLLKMISIGLGKQAGAAVCHDSGFGKMTANIPAIAEVVLAKANLIGAIGLLENAYHETCEIVVLEAGQIMFEEPGLLEKARSLAPKLYFDQLDVLIIDEIGKDISGTGFDTNVVGRYHSPYASGGPQISRIAVLDLTARSNGNANGLGIVDFTTRRVFEKMSFEATYPNSLTTTVPASVKIPMVLGNDRQAIQAAIRTCNILAKEEVRLVRIKNTLSLKEIEVSESLRDEVKRNGNLEPSSEAYQWEFDGEGNLF